MPTPKTSRVCANIKCRTTDSPLWRKGWSLGDGKHAFLCNRCGLHYKKGHFCPYCNQVYKEIDADDKDEPWLGCDRCHRWVHKHCEEKNGYSFHEGDHYLCPECRSLKNQLEAGTQSVSAAEPTGKSSQNSQEISIQIDEIVSPPQDSGSAPTRTSPAPAHFTRKARLLSQATPDSPSEALRGPMATFAISSPTGQSPSPQQMFEQKQGTDAASSAFDEDEFIKSANAKKRRRKPQERRASISVTHIRGGDNSWAPASTSTASSLQPAIGKRKRQTPSLKIDTRSVSQRLKQTNSALTPSQDYWEVHEEGDDGSVQGSDEPEHTPSQSKHNGYNSPYSADVYQPRYDWDTQQFYIHQYSQMYQQHQQQQQASLWHGTSSGAGWQAPVGQGFYSTGRTQGALFSSTNMFMPYSPLVGTPSFAQRAVTASPVRRQQSNSPHTPTAKLEALFAVCEHEMERNHTGQS